MKRPQKIRVLGQPWRIDWQASVKDDDENECYGTTDVSNQVIAMETAISTLTLEQETLLHELLHVAFHVADIQDHDESVVTRLARVLLALMRDNPGLLTYLRARKR